MRKLFVVVNAGGQAFAGVSSMSGRAMWFTTDDVNYLSDLQALRRKRDARWLEQARKWDVTAEWKEL